MTQDERVQGIDKEGGISQLLVPSVQALMPAHRRSPDDESRTLEDNQPRMNHPRNTVAHRRTCISLHRHQNHCQRYYRISPLPKHIGEVLLHDGKISTTTKEQSRCRESTAHPRHPDVEGIDRHQQEDEEEAQLLDEPEKGGRQNDHHDEVSHIPERQEHRTAVVGLDSEPSSPFTPYAVVPKHVETTILKEIIADTAPWFAMQEYASQLERQSPEHEEHVPREVWDYETVPSFLQFPDIHLFAILLNLPEKEISRYDEEDGYSTSRYHHGAEEPDIVIDGSTS